MSERLQTLYEKARRETARLLRFNIKRLSPEQTTRLDLATALRIGIDEMQGRIVRGESIDVAKLLSASDALAKLLPPEVLSVPQTRQDDPREVMLQIYLGMCERGELTDAKREPKLIERLQAENDELRATLAKVGGTVPRAITPPLSDIVPACERAECDPDPRPGPDDPPKPVVIESEYEEVVVTEIVTGEREDWRSHIDAAGNIIAPYWRP